MMRKIFLATVCIFLLFFLFRPERVSAEQIDLAAFMAANFDYNGFTSNDSYLESTGHKYSFTAQKYLHTVPQSVCPSIYNGDCEYVNWHFYYLGKKSPDQNIIYQSKTIFPGKSLELFWYNDDWMYDFMEPAFNRGTNYNDSCMPGDSNSSCFRNFHHEDPSIVFPNRGLIWYKRNFNSGDIIPIAQNNIRYFKNSQNYDCTSSSCGTIWSASFAQAFYNPNWNPAQFTWNNDKEYGYNLPSSLEAVILESTVRTPFKFKERYYYAKSGGNTFGLIRYDRWEDINKNCSNNNCPGIITDSDPVLGTLTLEEYGTLNLLTTFSSQNTGIDRVFLKSFYADPKLESFPTNGALPRGRIYVKSATTADGVSVTNDYLSLTEVLTDGDFLISTISSDNTGPGSFCPGGYNNQGSLVADFYDHHNNFFQNRWAILCTTNQNVIFATDCPYGYSSRGSIQTDGSGSDTNAYAYNSNINDGQHPVGGQKINLCVYADETHQSNKILFSAPIPTVTLTPTPTSIPPTLPPTTTPTPVPIPGDYNHNGVIDMDDINYFLTLFSTGNPSGDFNHNGIVDIYDYSYMAGRMGR